MQGIGPKHFYNNWLLTSSWKESFAGGGHGSFIDSTITINLQFRCANRHSNKAHCPIIPTILILPSSVIWILFYSNFSLLRSLHSKIFSKFTLIFELGTFSHASSILKKISSSSFHKESRFPKSHTSISKLRAFGHASSILKKKEIIFSSNMKVLKIHASICKLGAFSHASFIFKKGDHHHHLFIKNEDFK